MARKKHEMQAKSIAAFQFQAAVYKVQTLVDGGIRLTLDLPESSIPAAACLMECQRQGIPLVIDAKADNS